MPQESVLKKERHIVSWSQQEDDTLREQIGIHGTDNWATIASNFKDKTTRQCRRRWYAYLNSDFKRGGWSPEEDMLLCEAQKIFGNKWTEIAKVVSGRTDNAVKNRFTTLCKKRARYEALAKENDQTDGMPKAAVPIKKMRRSHLSASTESCSYGDRLHMNHQPRPPFAVLAQNSPKSNNSPAQHRLSNDKEIISDADSKIIKKDDPKVTALMLQAELLSSLAVKVDTVNTDQSFEHAWKVLQDFLNRSKEGDIFRYRISSSEPIDLQLEDLVEDLRSSNEGSQQSWRQDKSPCSSEYSKGPNLLPHTHTTGSRREQSLAHQEIVGERTSVGKCEDRVFSGVTINQAPSCNEQSNNDGVTGAEFGSPLEMTPVFRSLAAGIPSPKFSQSERNFLLKTFGVESASPNPTINPSHIPPCKRALLKSL